MKQKYRYFIDYYACKLIFQHNYCFTYFSASKMRKRILIFILTVITIQVSAQNKSSWEDSMVKSMTLDEKIGQLFMIAAYSNRDHRHTIEIENAIKKYHVGGLIFFQGTVGKQVYLTNYYQSISKTPLFIGQDAEWGVNMRIKEAPKYPYSMTLGAARSNVLSYETGRAMGSELKRMGVHISFAPVTDVNNNPNNPIIGFRSFGDNRENVAQKATAVAHGLQSEGVIACAKHFPGHGNTGTDSHLDLPILTQSRAELDSIELFSIQTHLRWWSNVNYGCSYSYTFNRQYTEFTCESFSESG